MVASDPLIDLNPSSTERLAEIAEILAAGLTRLWARKSSQKSAEGPRKVAGLHKTLERCREPASSKGAAP
jgi:hypothetical protein